VKAQAHALRELLEPRRVELARELGLAGDDDANQLFFLRFEAGQQPYLL
jgi:hypothetical protein